MEKEKCHAEEAEEIIFSRKTVSEGRKDTASTIETGKKAKARVVEEFNVKRKKNFLYRKEALRIKSTSRNYLYFTGKKVYWNW